MLIPEVFDVNIIAKRKRTKRGTVVRKIIR
jgi:hypothetical protein